MNLKGEADSCRISTQPADEGTEQKYLMLACLMVFAWMGIGYLGLTYPFLAPLFIVLLCAVTGVFLFSVCRILGLYRIGKGKSGKTGR